MNIKDIYWIAALLDGEGHFGLSNSHDYPRITLTMTDEDTVIRAKNIMNRKALIYKENRNPLDWKDQYILRINSHYAVGWMMILYCHPYMSDRRKEQIRQVLSTWRKSTSRFFSKATGNNLLKVLARKHCLPKAIVQLRLNQGQFTKDPVTGRIFLGLAPKNIEESRPFVNPFEKRVEV